MSEKTDSTNSMEEINKYIADLRSELGATIKENKQLKEELGKTKADLHIANEQIIKMMLKEEN
jgi:peptidoglycan hydrolase CwlO-like protein